MNLKSIKRVLKLVILAIFARKIYQRVKDYINAKKNQAAAGNKDDTKAVEEFYFKAVTMIASTPEEIANFVVNDRMRVQWDLKSQSAIKISGLGDQL